LNAIDVKPFREVAFDQKWYRSTGSTDVETDGEIVRTHTVVDKHDTTKAKSLQANIIRDSYIAERHRALGLADFYDAVGDNVNKQVWNDYVTELKNTAKTLKDAVDAAGNYDDIINFSFEWPTAPDSPVEEEI
jgi:hypothetical protein